MLFVGLIYTFYWPAIQTHLGAGHHSAQLQVCSKENENSSISRVVLLSFLLLAIHFSRHGKLTVFPSITRSVVLLRCCRLLPIFALYSSSHTFFCSLSTIHRTIHSFAYGHSSRGIPVHLSSASPVQYNPPSASSRPQHQTSTLDSTFLTTLLDKHQSCTPLPNGNGSGTRPGLLATFLCCSPPGRGSKSNT